MANLEFLQQKDLFLDTTGIPVELVDNAKVEVGQYLVNEIQRRLADGQSPVSGERFKKLNSEYAGAFKGGDRTPNLRLTSDMLSTLAFSDTAQGIAIGIFANGERPKADGHNNFSGASRLPKRRFIPGDNQLFKRDIMAQVDEILDLFRAPTPPEGSPFEPSGTAAVPVSVSANVDDILRSNLELLLG